jgi:hypothetical protein
MSFLATLTVDGKTFNLLECSSELEQKIDAKGRAISSVRGGNIRFVLDGSDDDTIPAWASDRTKKQDGTITFYKWDMQAKFKEIEFKDGYITWFAESFFIDNDEDMNFTESVVLQDNFDKDIFEMVQRAHEVFKSSYMIAARISSRSISVDGVEHANGW